MEAETPSLAHTCHTEVPNMSQLLLLSPPNEHSRPCRFPVFPQVCCESDLLVPIFHRVLPIGSQMLLSAMATSNQLWGHINYTPKEIAKWHSKLCQPVKQSASDFTAGVEKKVDSKKEYTSKLTCKTPHHRIC
jgi:hypothetical protein